MNSVTKSQLDSSAIKFQIKIRKNLQLFLFSSDAIESFCKQKEQNFEDYVFRDFLKKFKKTNFKEKSEIKEIKYSHLSEYGSLLVNNELSNLIFILNVADFEAWIFEFFNSVYLDNHKLLADKLEQGKNYSIDISFLSDSDNIEQVWGKIIEKYLSNKSYSGMSKVLGDLLSCLKIKQDANTKQVIENISELSLCRNLIIHNRGIVNKEYLRKSGKCCKYKINDTIVLSEEDLFNQVDLFLSFIQDIRQKIKVL